MFNLAVRFNLSSLYLFSILGVLGLITGFLSFIPNIPYAIFLYPAAIFLIAYNGSSYKQCFLFALFTGAIGYSVDLYWIYLPLRYIGDVPAFLSIPCIILLGLYLGLFSGACCVGMRFITQNLVFRGKNLAFALLAPILCGLTIAGAEVLCSFILTGFPWFVLSSAFSYDYIWIQFAAYIGGYGVSALISIGSCFLAFSLTSNDKKVLSFLLGLAFIIFLPTFGYLRINSKSLNYDEAKPIYVSMIQGNIDQNQKWTSKAITSTVNKYLSLTKSAIEDSKNRNIPLSLIVWPETSMPFSLESHPSLFAPIINFVKSNHIPIALGCVGYELKNNKTSSMHNRLLFLNYEGSVFNYYDKQKLVPFGEYTPFVSYIPYLSNLLQNVSFSSGLKSSPIVLNKELSPNFKDSSVIIGPQICYEAIFPGFASEQVAKGANILLVISNDAWYGRTIASKHLLGLSALRSVEEAKFMLRSTNTGITSVVSPYGSIDILGESFEDLFFTVPVYSVNQVTFYSNHIYLFLLFFGLCFIVPFCLSFVKKLR